MDCVWAHLYVRTVDENEQSKAAKSWWKKVAIALFVECKSVRETIVNKKKVGKLYCFVQKLHVHIELTDC